MLAKAGEARSVADRAMDAALRLVYKAQRTHQRKFGQSYMHTKDTKTQNKKTVISGFYVWQTQPQSYP